jgi:hypothetical protein
MVMHSSRKSDRVWRGSVIAAACCALVLAAGCTVSDQEAPPLSGPSGFGLSFSLTATPEVLPRDGQSISTIRVDARLNDQPYANQTLVLTTSAGRLSAGEIRTDASGRATFLYTAPTVNEPVSQATIVITAVQNGDLANARSDSIRIAVVGPEVPVAAFTTTPPTGAPGAPFHSVITFDATTTKLGTAQCGSSCTYSWNFGNGSSGSEMVVQHQYGTSGVFNATLTVTTASGTSSSVTKPVVIAPPDLTTPDFTFAPCASLQAKCMSLTDSSAPPDGVTIVSRYWDFGDGSSPVSTSDPSIDHVFPANVNPVTYQVKLRLTDNLGRVSTSTKPVAVP